MSALYGLYEDADGVLVHFVDHGTRRTEQDCVVWKYLDQQDDDPQDVDDLRVSDTAEFFARFKPVPWSLKTDIYSILHRYLDRETSYRMAKEIEGLLTDELRGKLSATRRLVELYGKEGPSVVHNEAAHELAQLGVKP